MCFLAYRTQGGQFGKSCHCYQGVKDFLQVQGWGCLWLGSHVVLLVIRDWSVVYERVRMYSIEGEALRGRGERRKFILGCLGQMVGVFHTF